MMEGQFSLGDSTVAIVGLGLMGGSLALALQGHCKAVVGSDVDPTTVAEAIRRDVVVAADLDPACVLPGADVVILTAPVPAILQLLGRLDSLIPHPCIVIDIGSTKRLIVDAMSRLPGRFEPVGGHPLCGKERLSLSNAEAGLYKAAPFMLTPLERTTARAMSAASQIVEAIGAKPVVVGPEEHDRLLATTSHMPFLLCSALVLAAPQECAPLVGPGFRSTSRLAGTSASMMLGVLRTNRENVIAALDRLQNELASMAALLAAENYVELEGRLNDSKRKYEALVQ